MKALSRFSPGGLVKLQNSNFKFGVYSTNGEQLKGDLSGYSELARQFDIKRIAFYWDASKDDVLIGTRLLVQIVGGREERAIFLKKYSRSEISLSSDFINNFYSNARIQVENLNQVKYQVMGISKNDDLPIIDVKTNLSTLSALVGKFLLKEPVKIKIDDLLISFGVIKKIIEELYRKNILIFKIAITRYPIEADILISPNISNPDIEISNDGTEKKHSNFLALQPIFEEISAIFDNQKSFIIKTIGTDDPDSLSGFLKKSLVKSEIVEKMIRTNDKGIHDICNFYRQDPESLYVLFKKIFEFNKTMYGITNESLNIVLNYIIQDIKNPDPIDLELLKTGYKKTDSIELKQKIQKYFISAGIIDEFLFNDLIKYSINNSDVQLLSSIIKSPAFEQQTDINLNNIIKLHGFDQKQFLAFLELFIKSNIDREIKGKEIYNILIRIYENQQFDIKKLNQIQNRYHRPLNPLPPPRISNRPKTILIIITLIAVVGLIFSITIYFNLIDFNGKSNQAVNKTEISPNVSINNKVLLIKIMNESYFGIDGNIIPKDKLYQFISNEDAISIVFSYNDESYDILKANLTDKRKLEDFIDKIINTNSKNKTQENAIYSYFSNIVSNQ
jgi:hypothetical protein